MFVNCISIPVVSTYVIRMTSHVKEFTLCFYAVTFFRNLTKRITNTLPLLVFLGSTEARKLLAAVKRCGPLLHLLTVQ